MREYHHRIVCEALFAAPLLAVLALQGCQGDRPPTEPSAEQAARPASPAGEAPTAAATAPTVDEVKETPERFYGRQVRLTGEVDEVFSDRAFELEGTGWAFDDDITVLARTSVQLAGAGLEDGDELIVSGTVRPMVVAEVERELGWDLSPELEVRLKERPVLVADSIRRVRDQASWTPEGQAQPVAAVITIVTAVDPGALDGQQVDLGRERVQSVMGRGLWIGPGHMSQIFVLPQETPEGVEAGDEVQVTGTLRKVPKDAVKAWKLPKTMAGVVREEYLFIDEASVRELPARQRPET